MDTHTHDIRRERAYKASGGEGDGCEQSSGEEEGIDCLRCFLCCFRDSEGTSGATEEESTATRWGGGEGEGRGVGEDKRRGGGGEEEGGGSFLALRGWMWAVNGGSPAL